MLLANHALLPPVHITSANTGPGAVLGRAARAGAGRVAARPHRASVSSFATPRHRPGLQRAETTERAQADDVTETQLHIFGNNAIRKSLYEVLNEVQQALFVDRYSRLSGLTQSSTLDGQQALKLRSSNQRLLSPNAAELALRVIRAKGLDEADTVLRVSITYRIVQALRLQWKRGRVQSPEKRGGVRVWLISG
jgi:hypothetical protein